jgi:hypothetical protein
VSTVRDELLDAPELPHEARARTDAPTAQTADTDFSWISPLRTTLGCAVIFN